MTITELSDVMLPIIYPQMYKRVMGSNGYEIYVEDPDHTGHSYDKHFWVEARLVDEERERNLLSDKTLNTAQEQS